MGLPSQQPFDSIYPSLPCKPSNSWLAHLSYYAPLFNRLTLKALPNSFSSCAPAFTSEQARSAPAYAPSEGTQELSVPQDRHESGKGSKLREKFKTEFFLEASRPNGFDGLSRFPQLLQHSLCVGPGQSRQDFDTQLSIPRVVVDDIEHPTFLLVPEPVHHEVQ